MGAHEAPPTLLELVPQQASPFGGEPNQEAYLKGLENFLLAALVQDFSRDCLCFHS